MVKSGLWVCVKLMEDEGSSSAFKEKEMCGVQVL